MSGTMFRLAVVLVMGASLVSCSDKSSNPQLDAFDLEVRLLDAAGHPIPGIRVSAWNKVPCEFTLDGCGGPAARRPSCLSMAWDSNFVLPPDTRLIGVWPNPFSGAATLRFNVAEPCSVALWIHDVSGRSVRFLYGAPAPAGAHSVAWDGRDASRNRLPISAYKIRFEVWTADRHSRSYVDSTWVAIYDSDPDRESSRLGYTDIAGRVGTTETTRFPSLFTYPRMTACDENGNEIGTFVFSDTLVIAASDTSAGTTRFFERALGARKNQFDLQWR
jgi:hypothetical protein